MIKSFRHKGLSELFATGKSAKVAADLRRRCMNRLDALQYATKPQDVDLPGFNFHQLHGNPIRYSIHVNGPWCITFEWEGSDAARVDLEQYH